MNKKENKCALWTKEDPLLVDYHNKEWCKINHDDRFEFEMLCLEGASVGLSWKTVLYKRKSYEKAFHNFDIDFCAAMTDEYLEELLKSSELIKNKNKIYSVRANALAVQKIQKLFGSFDNYLWNFTGGKQIIGKWENLEDIPVQTKLSQKISADMKKRGMSFVGPVITYSFLQAIGIVNDHLIDCEYR